MFHVFTFSRFHVSSSPLCFRFPSYHFRMHADIDRVLVTRDQIATRVKELARQITADHSNDRGEVEITLIPILTGAIVLAADLMRQMPVRMKIGLMAVSSYPGKSLQTQGSAVLGRPIGGNRGGANVVFDDILHNGGT